MASKADDEGLRVPLLSPVCTNDTEDIAARPRVFEAVVDRAFEPVLLALGYHVPKGCGMLGRFLYPAFVALCVSWTFFGWVTNGIILLRHKPFPCLPGWFEIGLSPSLHTVVGLCLSSIPIASFAFGHFVHRRSAHLRELANNVCWCDTATQRFATTVQRWKWIIPLYSCLVSALFVAINLVTGLVIQDSFRGRNVGELAADTVVTFVVFTYQNAAVATIMGYFVMACELHAMELRDVLETVSDGEFRPEIIIPMHRDLKRSVAKTSKNMQGYITYMSNIAALSLFLQAVLFVFRTETAEMRGWIFSAIFLLPVAFLLIKASILTSAIQQLPGKINHIIVDSRYGKSDGSVAAKAAASCASIASQAGGYAPCPTMEALSQLNAYFSVWMLGRNCIGFTIFTITITPELLARIAYGLASILSVLISYHFRK